MLANSDALLIIVGENGHQGWRKRVSQHAQLTLLTKMIDSDL